MRTVEINQFWNPDIRVVGSEKTPIIVVDDPIVATDSLRESAAQNKHFHVHRNDGYPGVRTTLPNDYVDRLLPSLISLLREVYEIPNSYEHQLVHRLFSLITTPPEDLAILQRVPHFDALTGWYFATVHYLNSGSYAGTGIFRHRPTGFERITQDRYSDYVQAAESHMKANGPPAAEYISSTNDHYELIEEIGYKANRLLIYPGNLLHSTLIRSGTDIDWNPNTGRLTANIFINFVEPGRRDRAEEA